MNSKLDTKLDSKLDSKLASKLASKLDEKILTRLGETVCFEIFWKYQKRIFWASYHGRITE